MSTLSIKNRYTGVNLWLLVWANTNLFSYNVFKFRRVDSHVCGRKHRLFFFYIYLFLPEERTNFLIGHVFLIASRREKLIKII